MHNISRMLFVIVAVAVVATLGFLATWDMPPPTTKVEKVIPNDRFTR